MPERHYTTPINSETPERPMLFEVGRDVTLAEFIQLNDDALKVRDETQAALRAQIKKPGIFFKKRRLKKNAELEEKIEHAAGRAAVVRGALQGGARLAFLDGHPEKIQAMMADPEKFIYPNDDFIDGAVTYKAEQIILLMYQSKTPATVPGIALAAVTDADKQATMEYTLFRLVSCSFYHHGGPLLAFSMLEAGARADGVILAEAVRNNAPPALVEQLLQHGADYNAAFDAIRGNPGYFGDTAQKLAAIRDTLAQKNNPPPPPPSDLQANKLDITSLRSAPPSQLRIAPRFRL